MNEQLRKQLNSPQSQIRHQAIVKLARLKDEDAIPLLNDISKNDPEPSLRKLAERAITHILNEFSSTISRVQPQEPQLSTVPPFSNPEVEKNIQKAYEQYNGGARANALQYLAKAIDLSPSLVDDFDVQYLAEQLTGIEGAISAKMLADREKRHRLFDDDLPPPSGNFPISPSSWVILILFFVVMSQFYLADGVEIINQALGELEVHQLKQSVNTIYGTDYFVVTPDSGVSSEGYAILIALPDGRENSSAMIRHFTELANSYGAILLVPDFDNYGFSRVEQQTITIDAMVQQVERQYPLDDAGIVLFGFGHGATIATYYANHYPDKTATVISSGGTFLYPQPESVPYVVMYGEDDELLRGVSDNYVPFADLTEWTIPLNYLTIENIGHEINIQQIDITKQILLNIYQ